MKPTQLFRNWEAKLITYRKEKRIVTYVPKSGADLRCIQELLGHSSTKTIETEA